MHKITRQIYQGGYPLDEDFALLASMGVNCLVNLDLPYDRQDEARAKAFKVCSVLLYDKGMNPADAWWKCLSWMLEDLKEPGNVCYVHCNAGTSRSPTLVWLYLMATGMDSTEAKALIRRCNPYACPGDPSIINDAVVAELLARTRS
jgi:protein-tyrosine phosphatase